MIDLLKRKKNKNKRLVALIDGEHHPQVTYDSLEKLKKYYAGKFAGLIFMGGTEKLVVDDLENYFGEKICIVEDIDTDFIEALNFFKPDIVYDLSDEPIVNYTIRMKVASFCFVKSCSYMGPDFLFEYEKKDIACSIPTISIIGTGKRIGKTAISAYLSKIFADRNKNICVVTMGRGGPRQPQILKGGAVNITPEYLLKLSKNGMHASSDYIEDALVSKLTTVGCRRCGGGFGGEVFLSNVKEGVAVAENLNPDLIVIEGSGASLPDVKTDANICIIGAYQSWESIVGYLGIYRLMISDLIIITMCEEPLADKKKIDFLKNEIAKINPHAKIIKTVFRPNPLSSISGKKVLVVMTAKEEAGPKIKNYLEEKYNCQVSNMTFNLSNRKELRKDLKRFCNYDTILTELKAASVDVVTDFAFKNKKAIVYLNNVPVVLNGSAKKLKDELGSIYNKIKLSKV